MIGFWTIAGGMTIVALLCVVVPLLRQTDEAGSTTSRTLIVSLYRHELADADRELLAGRVSKYQHTLQRHEIERRVLNDTASARSSERRTSNGLAARVAPCALLIPLIPAVAFALYIKLGTPAALTLNDPPGEHHDMRPESVGMMVSRLASRLTDHPADSRDAADWSILARSYAVLERPADAVAAYSKAVALDPGDAQLHADFADALATANDGRLDGRATQEIAAALSVDASNPKALALAASAVFDAHAYARAIGYWRRLEAQLAADSPIAVQARKNIDDAVRLTAVTVRVRLGEGMQVGPDAMIVVTARSTSASDVSGEVLAERRFAARELPATIVLDDTLAPRPDAALSAFPKVTVEARIEDTGASGHMEVMPANDNRSATVVIADMPK
ncbi:c-type cytochrome biogenesis protein CcmI [Caballeronia sp.]|uniref:c-type cytochrome biogenesis protein CcmI n=1 Tax=Caballeronia sp. TaxID=1931223 RepID=UPI003C66DEE5